MSIEKNYPKIYKQILDKELVDSLRDLLVVDENYDDADSEEFDSFDPDEYNFLVYIPERMQSILKIDGLEKLSKNLEKNKHFENFFLDDKDMYGIKTWLGEEEITKVILKIIEEELV